MDVFVSRDCVFYGYIRETASGRLLVVGPTAEFPPTIWLARRILEEMKEPLMRTGELQRFFETISCMPFTRFLAAVSFLNYVINGEQAEMPLLDFAVPSPSGDELDDLAAWRPIQSEVLQINTRLLALVE
jgi:hypothetical protein